MSETNTGGSAFPTSSMDGAIAEDGMTLRDYFAAKAMHALISYHGDKMYITDRDSRASLHLVAYEHADAMMTQRTKSTKGIDHENGKGRQK